MTLANLDWTQIVDRLASLASSTIAQESLRKLKPFSRAEDAEQSFQEIVASAEVIHKNLRSRMESLDLYLVWQPRLSKRAVLKTIELRDVRTFCSDHQWLRDSLQSCENEFLRQQFDASPDLAPALSFIDQIISPDGEIRSDASEKLFQLFREKERLQKEIQSQLDRMVKDFQMEHYLQDKFVTTREGRWVVPVKSGLQHHVPGVIHGSSHTKQTVYMEPERIIPTNNRLRQVEVEIEDEIERLLTELSHYLHDQMSLLTAAQGFLLRFDVLFAKAQLAIQIQGQIPQFSQNKLVLQDLAHPLLLLSDRDVV
ncbi:MAG TPA: endonuclease MutS2, partial [Pseudobdellovibrionaceae bacterium]|nr:endonuclease MutS2 [Pseudobdellovibrionaceae bacterium]